jgi:hypothetical protein
MRENSARFGRLSAGITRISSEIRFGIGSAKNILKSG